MMRTLFRCNLLETSSLAAAANVGAYRMPDWLADAELDMWNYCVPERQPSKHAIAFKIIGA